MPLRWFVVTDEPFLSATRTAYDTVAASYAKQVPAVEEDPVDHALLGAFADLVRAAGGGPVADIGCGPGWVTAYLDGVGLDVSGIDLSPEMIAVARRNYPGLRFSEGSMLALDQPDAGLAGVLAWYSIIHMRPARLPAALSEFHRVLMPEMELPPPIVGFLPSLGVLVPYQRRKFDVVPAKVDGLLVEPSGTSTRSKPATCDHCALRRVPRSATCGLAPGRQEASDRRGRLRRRPSRVTALRRRSDGHGHGLGRGSRPVALTSFMLNWEFIRATPGRSASLFM